MTKYENILSVKADLAIELLDFIESEGEEATIEYLANKYHDPGKHEIVEDFSLPTDTVCCLDNYILVYNYTLNHVGLVYQLD